MENLILDSNLSANGGQTSISRFTAQDKNNLSLAAYWARFIGIMGYIFLSIFVLIVIAMIVGLSNLGSMPGSPFAAVGGGVFALIIWVPLLFLMFYLARAMHRFGTTMRDALNNDDETILSSSFDNLRAFFRTYGIFLAVFVVIYAVAIIFMLLMGGFAMLG
jgi:hypothetical protein